MVADRPSALEEPLAAAAYLADLNRELAHLAKGAGLDALAALHEAAEAEALRQAIKLREAARAA